MKETPARPVANNLVIADADAVFLAQNNLRLFGYSVKESAAAPAAATFSIKNAASGAAAESTRVVNGVLAASGKDQAWFGPQGILCENGISLDWISGRFDIVIWAAGG